MLRAVLLAAGLTAVAAFALDTKTEAVSRDTTKTEAAPRRSLLEYECAASPASDPGWAPWCQRYVSEKTCRPRPDQGNCYWVPKLAVNPADAGTKMKNTDYIFKGFVLFPAKRTCGVKK